jgi:hypothetical protein
MLYLVPLRALFIGGGEEMTVVSIEGVKGIIEGVEDIIEGVKGVMRKYEKYRMN